MSASQIKLNRLRESEMQLSALQRCYCSQESKMALKSGNQLFQILNGIDWEIPSGSIQLLMGPLVRGKLLYSQLLLDC